MATVRPIALENSPSGLVNGHGAGRRGRLRVSPASTLHRFIGPFPAEIPLFSPLAITVTPSRAFVVLYAAVAQAARSAVRRPVLGPAALPAARFDHAALEIGEGITGLRGCRRGCRDGRLFALASVGSATNNVHRGIA